MVEVGSSVPEWSRIPSQRMYGGKAVDYNGQHEREIKGAIGGYYGLVCAQRGNTCSEIIDEGRRTKKEDDMDWYRICVCLAKHLVNGLKVNHISVSGFTLLGAQDVQ